MLGRKGGLTAVKAEESNQGDANISIGSTSKREGWGTGRSAREGGITQKSKEIRGGALAALQRDRREKGYYEKKKRVRSKPISNPPSGTGKGGSQIKRLGGEGSTTSQRATGHTRCPHKGMEG